MLNIIICGCARVPAFIHSLSLSLSLSFAANLSLRLHNARHAYILYGVLFLSFSRLSYYML